MTLKKQRVMKKIVNDTISMSATKAAWLHKSRRLLEIAIIVEQLHVEASQIRTEIASLERLDTTLTDKNYPKR